MVSVGSEARPKVFERAVEQPGDMHLGHADDLCDLGLGPVSEEPQDEYRALTVGQAGDHRDQGLVVLDVVEVAIERPDAFTHRGLSIVHDLVERVGSVGLLRGERVKDVFDRHVQAFGDLGGAGCAAELLGQGSGDGIHRGSHVLEPSGDPHRPRIITEVFAYLAGDRRHREMEKVQAAAGVEPVNGADQPDGPRLDEVFLGFAAAAEPPGDVPGHRQVARDQLRPDLGVPRTLRRKIDELLEQRRQM